MQWFLYLCFMYALIEIVLSNSLKFELTRWRKLANQTRVCCDGLCLNSILNTLRWNWKMSITCPSSSRGSFTSHESTTLKNAHFSEAITALYIANRTHSYAASVYKELPLHDSHILSVAHAARRRMRKPSEFTTASRPASAPTTHGNIVMMHAHLMNSRSR